MKVAAALLCSLACSLAFTQLYAQSSLPLQSIKLPPGFAIEVVARVPNARAMTWGRLERCSSVRPTRARCTRFNCPLRAPGARPW